MHNKNKPLRLQFKMIEAFRDFLFDKENAPSTIRKYISDINAFYQYLDSNTDVDKKKVLEYKNWLTERYAPTSVNSMLVALNQFWDFVGAGYLKVKRVKIQKQLFLKIEKEMTKQEYERLRDTAKSQKKIQLSIIIETLAVTGARVSELSYFKIEHIKKGKIGVINKGKRREILLADGLRKKLLYFAQKSGIKQGNVFITKTGNAKDRSNLWREMKELSKSSRVSWKKIFPHNLRHLFARSYYQSTKDLAGLADLLGHSSMDVTRIYTAETGDRFQKQIERLGLLKE